MKAFIKYLLIIIGVLGIVTGIVLYARRNRVTVVDTVRSSDGRYEVVLQSTGRPRSLFGAAPGQLVLSNEEGIISQADIEINNDGAYFNQYNWSVTWQDDSIEIILSSTRQNDEVVTMYYDGRIERYQPISFAIIRENTNRSSASDEIVNENDQQQELELFPGDQQMKDGYQALYENLSNRPLEQFEVYYGASESSTRCILFEDENTIDYLVYNGKSQNNACGLYVHYQCKKGTDGTWKYSDAQIIDIYAYVLENGDIISSGKRQWSDIASEAYQKAVSQE